MIDARDYFRDLGIICVGFSAQVLPLHEASLAFVFIFVKVSNVQICVQLDQRFLCMRASLIKSSIPATSSI